MRENRSGSVRVLREYLEWVRGWKGRESNRQIEKENGLKIMEGGQIKENGNRGEETGICGSLREN